MGCVDLYSGEKEAEIDEVDVSLGFTDKIVDIQGVGKRIE